MEAATTSSTNRLDTVYSYHDRTKHHLHRYARSLGYLDWATQPNPFRRFEGAPIIRLEQPAIRERLLYDSLFHSSGEPASLNYEFVSRLFYFSLALSAWKQVDGLDGRPISRWSLRVNPSSGNLHPTECYLLCDRVSGLSDSPATYHYAPFEHALELRRTLTGVQWREIASQLPPHTILVGLTSIYWRESWKYGERAFRYCHHDVGHAIAALALSAAALGWKTELIEEISSADLARLLGVNCQHGIEAEHTDCMLAVFPAPAQAGIDGFELSDELLTSLAEGDWFGRFNQLSSNHHLWPIIDQVDSATEWSGKNFEAPAGTLLACATPPRLPERSHSAEKLIRQRRSAVALDGRTSIDSKTFYRILQRITPELTSFPFDTLRWLPNVCLALFVHRVEDLPSGLYALVRDPAHEQSLRDHFRPEFEWRRPAGCPNSLGLYLLYEADVREAAQIASCHQAIAADGVFSAAMLAAFDQAIARAGPGMYPRLFWETGVIGQVLYLEAEAAGIRATGIGCFFDDAVHQILGIEDHTWQSLYHFTMGGPVDDPRLRTLDSYHHLGS